MQEKALQKKLEELENENAELLSKLKVYTDSPLETAYTAAVNTVNKYCEQCSKENVNLFDIEDKPKFEMVHKFMVELGLYLNTIDKIRSKMNPEIAKAIDKKTKQAKFDEKDKSLAL